MANAQANFETFQAWSAAKTPDEFLSIVYRGALNRKEIALQCGFAKSVLAQNPRIHGLLQELETRLRAEGILPLAGLPEDEARPDYRSEFEGIQPQGTDINMTDLPQENQSDTRPNPTQTKQPPANRNLESLVRRLQSENASQRAEIQELRRQLCRLSALQEALTLTGRLPR